MYTVPGIKSWGAWPRGDCEIKDRRRRARGTGQEGQRQSTKNRPRADQEAGVRTENRIHTHEARDWFRRIKLRKLPSNGPKAAIMLSVSRFRVFLCSMFPACSSVPSALLGAHRSEEFEQEYKGGAWIARRASR